MTNYFDRVVEFKSFSKEEELQLIIRYKENKDQSAVNKLIEAYTPFIKKAVKRFAKGRQNQEYIYEELMQEGMYGFIKGIEKFDINSGFRLVTYAQFWIKNYLQLYCRQNFGLIALPKDYTSLKIQRDFFKICNELNIPEDKHYSMESYKQVSKHIGINAKQIKNVIEAKWLNEHIKSLDIEISMEESQGLNKRLIDLISDKDSLIPFMEFEDNQETEMLTEIVFETMGDILDKRSIDIVKRSVMNGEVMETIAKDYNITRERVRQIREKSLMKIKENLSNYNYV